MLMIVVIIVAAVAGCVLYNLGKRAFGYVMGRLISRMIERH